MSRAESESGLRPPGLTEYSLLLALGIAWGSSYMFTKIAVADLHPLTLVAVRTFIAAAVLLALLGLQGGFRRLSLGDVASFALVGLVAIALPLGLIAWSVSHVDSSVTATAMALVPLITALMAMLRGEYPSWRNIIGIGVGIVGIGVLFGPDAFASFGDSAKGVLGALGASVAFSASLFAMNRLRHFESSTVSALSMGFAAPWSILFAILFDDIPDHLPDNHILGAVAVLALFNTAAANIMLFAIARRAGAAFTSYNNYVVPGVAVLCGTIFLGEPLTIAKLIGVLLVLAGVTISTYRRRLQSPAAAPASSP